MINKYTGQEYGKQFFYSDLHHNHGNIFKYDGRVEFMTAPDLAVYKEISKDKNSEMYKKWKPSWSSLKNMEDEIIERANEVVGVNDTLWFLGDFSFARYFDDVIRFRKRFNCKDMRIVYGNHDDRSLLMPVDKNIQLFSKGYDAVMIFNTPEGTFDQDEVSYDINIRNHVYGGRKKPQKIYLSHYCSAVWEGSHRGNYHLYGHSHTNLNEWTDKHMPNALSMDVGCMGNNYYPYSLEQIHDIMRVKAEKGIHAIDHHNSEKVDE